ncbi:MAG: hypothetical protein FWG88_06220 [Oscillospiraceae bacterium]|nr:hypothetical protein [Oscillospiraceae bacterium]
MGKLERIRVLKRDLEIKELLEAASQIFRNPIAMFDTNYTLITYTEVITDDPIWNELVTRGSFSNEMQQLFADVYFTFDVANTEKIVVLKHEQLKYDRVNANIHNKNRVKVANIVMVACNHDLDADDLVAFSALADKLTAKIKDDEYYTQYAKDYLSDLIIRLIDGELTDTKLYTPHVRILYNGFEPWLYLAIIQAGVNANEKPDMEQIMELLASKYKSYKYAIYNDSIIIIMSSKNDTFRNNRMRRDTSELFEHHDLYMGVSSNFENLFQLEKHYKEALDTLQNGIALNNNKRIFYDL